MFLAANVKRRRNENADVVGDVQPFVRPVRRIDISTPRLSKEWRI
jgi:hypothetical protein